MEDEEDDKRLEEEEAKKREKSPLKDLYRDNKTGKLYDPNKKFGTISPEKELIYDNVTSSYQVNLPTDYYRNYVQDSLPNKDAAKWFIRPHHVESLTNHT